MALAAGALVLQRASSPIGTVFGMPRPIYLLRRLARLAPSDWSILLEACVTLAIASVLVSMFPFRFVARLASRQSGSADSQRMQHQVSKLRWALEASAPYLPWRTMCIEKGVAAHFMLRRRKVAHVVYYGLKRDEAKGLKAHVWVTAGELPVIGVAEAVGFAPVASFPPAHLVGTS